MLLHTIKRGLSSVASNSIALTSISGASIPRAQIFAANRIVANNQFGNRFVGMTACANHSVSKLDGFGRFSVRNYNSQSSPSSGVSSFSDVLEREIQDEMAELNQQLSTDQFQGFSVETDGSDVKLTKQMGATTVTVRFTVSSSLTEWPTDQPPKEDQQQDGSGINTSLRSMPEFQVQISKHNQTLELTCYFEDMDSDEETGEPLNADPLFSVDELVIYEGQPKETEFAVSAEYFSEDLQQGLLDYLAEHGIDDQFAKNLVQFSTSYEKKQYIGLVQRLKSFVSK